jgi:hypothetical protein
MNSDITIVLRKDGVDVRRVGTVAHAEGHPGPSDWVEGVVNDVWNAVTTQTFLGLLGGLVGTILPAAEILVWFQQAKELANQTVNIINDMFRHSDKQYQASAEITLDETDDFDEILLSYHAYSDDDIKDFRHVTGTTWSKFKEMGGDFSIDPQIEEKSTSYFCSIFIKTATLEDGLLPAFICCAIDKGSSVAGFDVLTLSSLAIKWRKKPKADCTSLRQLSESIDPPGPLRSLRKVSDILGINPPSLRGCCEEQAKCRSIQECSLSIFEQNAALLPEHLTEIDILGVMKVPVFDLYKGSNRQEAIETFVAYLTTVQPDIAGFCEFWVPEERAYLRSRLAGIYPEDSAFYAEGPSGGAPGYTTIMDNGGLLLLSKWPIFYRDQIIYTACQGEDCFSAKGAIYAGIAVPGFPSLIHVFLTHMQSCPPEVGILPGCGPGDGCWEKLKVYQVAELRDFAQRTAGQGPCILMGDFNLNGVDENIYKGLMDGLGNLGNPNDAWKSVADHGVEVFCPGADLKLTDSDHYHDPVVGWDINKDKGMTKGGKGFESGQTCEWDDPDRQDGGRIDYILSWPNSDSSRYLLSFSRSRVVMILMNQSKDASDHYGSYTVVKSIRERK